MRVWGLGILCAMIVSCSSAPPTTVTGTWSGTWNSTSANTSILNPGSGNVILTIMQSGTSLTGSGDISPYGNGTLTGMYSPTNGNVTGKVSGSLGDVSIDGKAAGDGISGTYISSAGDNGTFSLTKKN